MDEIKFVCIEELYDCGKIIFTKNKHYKAICDEKQSFYYITCDDGEVVRFINWELKYYFITLEEHRDIRLKELI
jgi:hypothetical protein